MGTESSSIKWEQCTTNDFQSSHYSAWKAEWGLELRPLNFQVDVFIPKKLAVTPTPSEKKPPETLTFKSLTWRGGPCFILWGPKRKSYVIGGRYKKVGQFKGNVCNWNCSETELASPKHNEWSSLEDSKQHLDAHLSRMLEKEDFQGRKLVWMVSEGSSHVILCSGCVWFVSTASILWGATLSPLYAIGEAVSQGASLTPPIPGEGLLPILANWSSPISLTILIGLRNVMWPKAGQLEFSSAKTSS